MKKNLRYLSILILLQSQQKREPVDPVMEKVLSQVALTDPRDSHLIMALVYGVLRRQSYLDAVLRHFSHHPLHKMKSFTLQALRVGAFQLLFMDRIPASAAVNETVKAVKEARQPKWLVNFVNGMLRSLSRQGLRPDLWEEDKWPAQVKLSHPGWLYKRYRKRYGKEKAEEICENNNRQPCLTLSLNLSAIQRNDFIDLLAGQDLQAMPGRYLGEAVILPDYNGLISGLPGYDRGWFMVQDEGAQLITRMLAPFHSASYLDACAGLGGKTVQLHHLIPADSRLTALEPNRRRFLLLEENLRRTGSAPAVTPFNMDLQSFGEKAETPYDNILIDAPCSGLGVIRRHPDIRWRLSKGVIDLKRYRETQTALLRRAGQLLSSGGVMVYATCSTEPEENDEVVEQFLAGHTQFKSEPPNFPEGCEQLLDRDGFLRLLPDKSHDGFFAVRLVRC